LDGLYGSGEIVKTDLKLHDYGGLLELSYGGHQQTLLLVAAPRHAGGL